MLIFSKLQRKCIFSCIFFQKYLVMSKKSSTFAGFFARTVPHVPTRMRKISMEYFSNNH